MDARLVALAERCDNALLTPGDYAVVVLDRSDIAMLAEYLPDLLADGPDRDQGRHQLGWWAVYQCGCSYLGGAKPARTCQHRRHSGGQVVCEPTAIPLDAARGYVTAHEEKAAVRRQGVRS